MAKINLTDEQRKSLEKLWFIYGNDGEKCTKANHGYIQGFLEHGEDRKTFYLEGVENMRERGIDESFIKSQAITQECINEVEKIFNYGKIDTDLNSEL